MNAAWQSLFLFCRGTVILDMTFCIMVRVRITMIVTTMIVTTMIVTTMIVMVWCLEILQIA